VTDVLSAPSTTSNPVLAAARVIQNRNIGDRYWQLVLEAPTVAERSKPGQFVMLSATRPGELDPVLPRPMALYDWDSTSGHVEIIYGVVGRGTHHLSTFHPGEELRTMGPVGQGFDLGPAAGTRLLVVGRGIGTCSLMAAAADAALQGAHVTTVESAREPRSLFAAEKYASKGISDVHTVTDAEGTSDPDQLAQTLRGHLAHHPPTLILTCGSSRLASLCMQLADEWNARLQVSVEAHMACGLGYCHGCSSGRRSSGLEGPLVCHDGPVFEYDPTTHGYTTMGTHTRTPQQ